MRRLEAVPARAFSVECESHMVGASHLESAMGPTSHEMAREHDDITLLRNGGRTDIPFSFQEDADCIENELEEFYSYIEAPLLLENKASWMVWARKKWNSCCMPADVPIGAWKALDTHQRRRILHLLLDALDLHDTEARTTASHALLYHLQGSFGETDSEQEQLALIRENARMVFDLGGIEDIFVACKRACWRHHMLNNLSDQQVLSENSQILTPQEKAECLESINVEISTHFSQLYTVIESLRGEFALSEILMTTSPPLPIYFLGLIANLREKSIGGFPVKKLVLLTWKSVLASLGGYEALQRCKEGVRSREGLAPKSAIAESVPVSPQDMRQFHAEVTAKYPTLVDEQQAGLLAGITLSDVTSALPTRLKGNGQGDETHLVMDEERLAVAKSAAAPPPLKPGRQKFQTDQSRPFILPFASEKFRDQVPLGIQEAFSLYQDHLYVKTSTWQTWLVRQELLNELRGARDPSMLQAQRALSTLHLENPMHPSLNTEDEQRLEWVEQIYRQSLPSLQSAVIVLLKVVLATSTPGNTNSAFGRAVAENVPPEHAPPPTLEDVDVIRHREILNKGVTFLLLLCLRWFKVNHALQFEYLAQILLDSNIILLILKLFGLQETNHAVHSRCEASSFGLFRYCRLVGHDQSTHTSQSLFDQLTLFVGNVWDCYPDDPLRLRHTDSLASSSQPYSWRNLATTSNMIQILYQVCKSKLHRILLLVQYKSSAILKRMLNVPNRQLELYVLKLLKFQIPYCGRKWRQSNMRIITQIYLRCHSKLREDWPGGSDLEAEVEASLPEEQTLRTLIQFFNRSRYQFRAPIAGMDISHATVKGALGPEWVEADRDAFEREAFPPRPVSSGTSTPGRYISGVSVEGYLDAYEDFMQEMNDTLPLSTIEVPEPESTSTANSTQSNGQNLWEHLSPHEMDILSRSPRTNSGTLRSPHSLSTSSSPRSLHSRRLSLSNPQVIRESVHRVNSSPGTCRPLMHWNMEELVEDAISTEEDPPEIPVERLEQANIPERPLASPKPGGIDEVEHIFGA